jgi:tetratricopeptide (TPR) repeat protein
MDRGGQAGSVPAEFKELLTPAQTVALEALQTLQANPEDSKALLTMADFYFDLHDATRNTGDPAIALGYARQAIRYYDRYLAIVDTDNSAQADLASSLFYSGQTDRAIQEVGEVLQRDPNHVQGNFNLGIFYWQGRRDFEQASAQFEKVIRLTENDPSASGVNQQARIIIEQVRKEAESAGTPLGTTEASGTM